MANKAAKDAAYTAGRAAASIAWDDDATDEQRAPGEHHCPFGLDQADERAAWLRGLADALEEPKVDRAKIVLRLQDEIGVADEVAS